MALSRYAASGVIRNRRRTFSSILGVLLAITFVSGTFIAIDSSTRATLDALLANTPGDFSYSAGTGFGTPINGPLLRQQFASVVGVTEVSLWRDLPIWGAYIGSTSPRSPDAKNAYVQAVDPEHLPWILRGLSFVGSLALPNGSVAITSESAMRLTVGVGDSLFVVVYIVDMFGEYQPTAWVNVTIGAVFTAPQGGYPSGVYPGPYFPGETLFVSWASAPWLEQQLGASEPSPYAYGEIWIDRARFIDPYNTQGTGLNIKRFYNRFAEIMQGYPGSITDNISIKLATFNEFFAQERLVFLLLSLPVVLLGLYLGAVGVDLGHAERRRELAVLKTRGAGRGQVLGLLVLEAVLGGLLAMIFGLVAGVAMSRALLGVINPVGVGYVPRYGDILLSPSTIVTVGFLSILFMAAVSYRSAKRTSGLPIVESLRYYAPGETKIGYNPWWDLFEVGYGGAAYMFAFFMRMSTGDFFSIVFGIILIASLPLVPIFLTVGATRLLTRTTGKVYEWTARALRPVAKNMEYVISRNLSRNPRRASNIAIIIGLGLAFGVFILSMFGSQQAYQVRLVRATVGADMSVWPGYQPNGSVLQALRAMPGIAGVSEVINSPGQPPSRSVYVSVWALDPATYFSVAKPEYFYFDTPFADRAASVLAQRGNVLITRAYADAAGFLIGDRLPIISYIYSNGTQRSVMVNVTVAGIVRFLPGTGNTGGIVYGPIATTGAPDPLAPEQILPGPAGAIVYGSIDTLQDLWKPITVYEQNMSSSKYLVSLAPGADWRAVLASIRALNVQVTSAQEQIEALASNNLANSFLGFIQVEIAFMVLILTAGLGLIIYAASLERDVEFAAFIARGSSGWQTAGLLIGEAFSIMVIGVLVGVTVGLLSGYLYTEFLFVNPMGGVVPTAVPYLFIFPIEGWLLVASSAGSMLLAALLVSWRIVRMDVARVLKMRGG